MRAVYRISCSLALMGTLVGPVAAEEATSAAPWPNKVVASFKITLAGFELGTFDWTSTVNGHQYDLQGRGALSAAFGVWKWRGTSHTTGTIEAEKPVPAAYRYEWRTSKQGSSTVEFADNRVAKVALVPESTPSPENVPVKPEHLNDVFDPMSAIMALSLAPAGNPCGRRIAIFDGKQRFDVILNFRRQIKITEARPSGQPLFAYVCHVKYVPISGHRASTEVNQLSKADNIEVAFRLLPSARLLVPYRITIPTAIGTVEMASRKVDITTAGNRQIALVH